jgi:hypothetical protein
MSGTYVPWTTLPAMGKQMTMNTRDAIPTATAGQAYVGFGQCSSPFLCALPRCNSRTRVAVAGASTRSHCAVPGSGAGQTRGRPVLDFRRACPACPGGITTGWLQHVIEFSLALCLGLPGREARLTGYPRLDFVDESIVAFVRTIRDGELSIYGLCACST